MVLHHAKRKRKATGGLYRKLRDKRKFEMGRTPALTKIKENEKINDIRTRGNNKKLRALALKTANVLNKETGKTSKAEIKKVLENKASRHYPRMGVMTKGAIIETDKGKAKITNRPGQEGKINAVLVK